jgi:hypothetical protein
LPGSRAVGARAIPSRHPAEPAVMRSAAASP